MKTLKRVDVTVEFIEGELPFENLEFGKFYISKEKMHCSHMCLCGCEGLVCIPIKNLIIHEDTNSNVSGPNNGWNFTVKDELLTITPSILNRPCEGHYIVTKGIANLV